MGLLAKFAKMLRAGREADTGFGDEHWVEALRMGLQTNSGHRARHSPRWALGQSQQWDPT